MVDQEKVLAKRSQEVKFILLVLSARGMVFDLEALRQKIFSSYPDAAVFFKTQWASPLALTSSEDRLADRFYRPWPTSILVACEEAS